MGEGQTIPGQETTHDCAYGWDNYVPFLPALSRTLPPGGHPLGDKLGCVEDRDRQVVQCHIMAQEEKLTCGYFILVVVLYVVRNGPWGD